MPEFPPKTLGESSGAECAATYFFCRKSVFLATIREEILQKPLASGGGDAIINLWHMVALGMRKHPRTMGHATGFGV